MLQRSRRSIALLGPQRPFTALARFSLALACILIGASCKSQPDSTTSPRLALPLFYTGHHVANGAPGKVDDLSEPEMGWITHGKPVSNPTKVATQGLQAVLGGDSATARLCADWLLAHSKKFDDAISFPFEFDFVPYWPFELRAPWSSAITQALALGLFTQLYLAEHREEDLAAARRIAAFYLRPIEKGGFTRFEKAGPYFEEYPTAVPTRVLNGSLIAMLALRDFALIAHDDKSSSLFQRSTQRLHDLLPDYEFDSLEDGCTLSCYSLAPIRPRLIMRFTGAGRALIHAIRFVGERNGSAATLAELHVGAAGDANPMQSLYVWDDPKYMNWGPPTHQSINGRDLVGRIAGEHKGEFDHSPFVLGWLPDFDAVKNPAIEVDFVPLAQPPMLATVYDGIEYWSLGPLEGAEGALKTARLAIPSAFPLGKVRTAAAQARVDIRYLDDNQRLLELLGELTGDKIVSQYAARWKESCLAVPARWMNWASATLLAEGSGAPLPIDPHGCRLRGQPAVIRVGGKMHLFYVAADPDGRERICLATSSDAKTWEFNGQIFADAALPIQTNCGHPTVVEMPGASNDDRYLMAFTLGDAHAPLGQRLCIAHSPNAFNWSIGAVPPTEDVADPLLLPDGRGGCELFYLPVTQGFITHVVKMQSTDGRTWTLPRPVITQKLYTPRPLDLALSGLEFQGKTVLLLENSTRQNRHALLFARDSAGEFRAWPGNPVFVCDEWLDRWDAVRFDWCLIPDGDGFVAYYAGAAKRNYAPTDSLPIGRARLKLDSLRSALSDVSAWLKEMSAAP